MCNFKCVKYMLNKLSQTPKVSIIIPIYNVEKFIKKCAISLLEQTYPNIEYIFVNDASTDRSFHELQSITSKYNSRNTIIINNDLNKGSSATRNEGLNIATGEFINFCDSDDWVEPHAIEEMVTKALTTDADIIVTPFYTNTFNKEKTLNFKSNEIANLNKIPIDFLHFSLCNKLIKTSLIKEHSNYSISGIDCWEDLSVISRLYALEPKVVLLNTPFYHYRKYEYKSLTSDSHERQLNDRLQYADFLSIWFKEKHLEQKYAQFLNHLKFTAKIKMLRTSPRQFHRWKTTYPESNKYIMSYTDIPLYYRLLFYFTNLFIKS